MKPDPVPQRIPSFDLPRNLSPPFAQSIVSDLCFLAFLNDDFRLCETPKKIEDRLESPYPCWEKRWAGMLSAWNKRAEMDWEDVVKVSEKPKSNSSSSRIISCCLLISHSSHTLCITEHPCEDWCSQRDSYVTECESLSFAVLSMSGHQRE